MTCYLKKNVKAYFVCKTIIKMERELKKMELDLKFVRNMKKNQRIQMEDGLYFGVY